MAKILIGLLFIVLGVFDHIQLRNKKSWWAWTNWWARGHRDALGDAGHEKLASTKSILLIAAGIFFILDQVLGLGIIPDVGEGRR